MAKMIHATVHENAYQVTIQAVFRKPENLTQSAFYIDESNGQYGMNSERSSTFSSTFNSDGTSLTHDHFRSMDFCSYLQMNIHEWPVNLKRRKNVRKNDLNQRVLLARRA